MQISRITSWAATIVLTALAPVFTACVPQEQSQDTAIEGQPTNLQFSITAPAGSEFTITKATDLQETQIANLALLFYKGNSVPHIIELTSENLALSSKPTSTNYIYDVALDEDQLSAAGVTSGEWTLYAIANYSPKSKGFAEVKVSDLAGVKLSDLGNYLVTKTSYGANDIVMNESCLLMTGKFGRGDGSITLYPAGDPVHKNEFTGDDRIHLRRITAKITFELASGSGVTFTPTSYGIYNYNLRSPLFEKSVWKTNDGKDDNVNGSFSGTYSTDGLYKDIPSIPVAAGSNNKFTFYMHENAHPGKGASSYEDREKRLSDYDSFTYAPKDGTYVVIKGKYTGPGETSGSKVSGDVTYTVHLGNFSSSGSNVGSYDNFTVRRNAKYNYKITVNGVNSIITEATTDVENQPGAEGNIVAGGVAATDILLDCHFGTVMLKIPSGKIANYGITSKNPYENVTFSTKVAGSTKPAHVEWVKFGKPASSTAFAAYKPSAVTDIYGLIDDINKGAKTYYLESGGYYYVTAYVNEYFYEGESDLSKFVNADSRVLTFTNADNIKESSDKHSSYSKDALFSIRQKSIKSVYNLATAPNPFGIELDEETPFVKWYGSTVGSSDVNGQSNTWSIIGSGNSWSTYVNAASNGYINGSYSSSAMTTSGQYANYSCLSRNRDENGDGKITRDEIKWYLPSRDQSLTLIYGRSALGDDVPQTMTSSNPTQRHEVMWYWTSSAGNGRQVNFLEYTTSGVQSATTSVRCVRSLRSVTDDPTSVTRWDASTNTMNVEHLSSHAMRGPMSGEYVDHYNDSQQNIFSSAFEFASRDLSTATDGEKYTIHAPTVAYNEETATYGITVDKNIVKAELSNYNTLESAGYIISGYTLSNPLSIDASALSYNNDVATVSLSGTRTISGVAYTSNTTTIGIRRTSSGTGSYTLEAPKVSATVTSSGSFIKSYTVNVTITNYDSNLSYFYNTNGKTATQNKISSESFSVSGSPTNVYVYAVYEGNISNPTQIVRNNGNIKSTNVGSDRTINMSSYSYSVTSVTNGAKKTVTTAGSAGKSTFSLNEVYPGTMCRDYYYEKEDKSDLGQWRIPNQMELLTYFQTHTNSEMLNKNYASKTRFNLVINTSTINVGYYFQNVFYIQSEGSNTKVTASAVQLGKGNEGKDYYKIRCVRDK